MFHRVKSDVQGQQDDVSAAKPPEARSFSQPEGNPFKPAQAPSSAPMKMFGEPAQGSQNKAAEAKPSEVPAAEMKIEKQPEPQKPQKTPSNEAKDTKSMTEQDNTQSEKTYGEDRDLPISAYARTGATPMASRTPVTAYPGAYPAYGAKPAQESSAVSSSDRRLTIGSGITLSGEIESCDYLLVEGTVEAALKGANVLDIAQSGVFYGTVEIGEATIAGRFEGDITVHGRLTVTSSGTVTGSISYKELAIEAGAVIDGKITPLSAVPSVGKKPSAAGKAKPARDAVRGDNAQDSANSDEGLFSKAAAAAE
jgi:cytoskeletal protein CcmA (bactofilin family)